MKKRYILLIMIIVIGLYLNLSYSYIYRKIGVTALTSPQTQKTYTIGDSSGAELTYVAIGDSLTSGVGVSSYDQSYPYQFAKKLSQKNKKFVTLTPLAIPGARTDDAAVLLLDDVIRVRPDIITILFGVNDVHNQTSKDNFYTNYKFILDKLSKETDAEIYIINVPYIGASNLVVPPYNFYFDARTQEFNKILKQLSDEYSVAYIDLYAGAKNFAEQKGYYARDLFHPSTIGYTLWSNIIYDAFNK